MKKWLIGLCCVLAVTAIAFVTVVNNQNGRIDTLNKDLGEIQTEVNALKEKNAESEKTIQGLNGQVDSLTAERDLLTAENGKLAEDLEALYAPVGESWWLYRSSWPDIEMYDGDGAHASEHGIEFAAKIIWNTIETDCRYEKKSI